MASVQFRSMKISLYGVNYYILRSNADVRILKDGRIQAKIIDLLDSGVVGGDFFDNQVEVWSEDWYDIGLVPNL